MHAWQMLFAYLDDFGHSGPYIDRADSKHNTSPVFGFAGFVLPDSQVRPFSSFFIQLKGNTLKRDLDACGKHVARWEKKGTSLFTRKALERYTSVRESGFRLLYEIRKRGGFVFYYGREKMRDRDDLKSVGLQTTVLSHTIRRLDEIALRKNQRLAIVMDQSSSRGDFLDTAQKTMFGKNACRQIVSPPFEVVSHLDQNVQAADWIAALLGKLYAHKLHPESFPEYEIYERFFWRRMESCSHGCSVERHNDIKSSVRKSGKITKITETVTTTTIEIDPSGE